MERDFLGLAVKQETSEEVTDAAPLRKSTLQWTFPSKGSAIPQLLSFQEDNKPNAGFGSLATGLLAITTDAFDSDHNLYGAPQKTMAPERQGSGVRYAATAYNSGKHADSHVVHHTVTNQSNLKLAPSSVHRSFVDTCGLNPMGALSLGSQPVASVPFANPVTAVPSSSPHLGSTVLRNGSKISGTPTTQLTIFYNGSVCVYDNITPDKAQAIMLLAGNAPPTPRAPILDPFVVNQPYSRTSTPIEVTPLSIAPPAVHSCTNNGTIAAKPTGVFMSSAVFAEPLRTAKSANFLSPDTVPQFRKKSLARFLEKRKERVISASPYAADKGSPDSSSNSMAKAVAQ